jgi:hypothetical protein
MLKNLLGFLKKTTKTIKHFDYEKGGINLNFSLNIDKKDQLVSFLELLKEAEKDVEEQIDEFVFEENL